MSRVLELSNSENWEQIYTTNISAVTVTPGYTAPIPEITIPILFDVHVLAVYLTTDVPENSTWFFGGFLYQKFQLGLVVGGNPDADTIGARRLDLNKVNLILFPKLTTTYSLTISVPKWFKNVSVVVWQYTGDDFDSVDAKLLEIEQKIDDLATYGNP